jgi:hypothetical protein
MGLLQHNSTEPVTIISFPNQGTTIIMNIQLDL